VNAVVLLWLNDDKAREIDDDPSEVMFGESSESNLSRDEVCPFIGQCFGDRLYLKEDSSLTLNARIMCPGLMVRVTIREVPASGLASGACRAHAAHARDQRHSRWSRASKFNSSIYHSISSTTMLALFPCLLSLAYENAPIKREKESFEVKTPAVGDTIALAESRCNELSLT
jgi:hypothetical protein